MENEIGENVFQYLYVVEIGFCCIQLKCCHFYFNILQSDNFFSYTKKFNHTKNLKLRGLKKNEFFSSNLF